MSVFIIQKARGATSGKIKHPAFGARRTFHQAALPGLRRVSDLDGETGDFFLRVAAGNPHLGAWQRRLRAEQQQETQAQKPMEEPVVDAS